MIFIKFTKLGRPVWQIASQNIPNISWRSDGVAQSNTVGSYGMTYGPGVSPKTIYNI
jgi:hypothetical protein